MYSCVVAYMIMLARVNVQILHIGIYVQAHTCNTAFKLRREQGSEGTAGPAVPLTFSPFLFYLRSQILCKIMALQLLITSSAFIRAVFYH